MTNRGLVARRISRSTDESTSLDRQSEWGEWWASGNDTTIVDTATDESVSGMVSPFEREGLGPWLTDNPPKEWDILIAWKLDRVSRSALDTMNLLQWLQDHGKRLVCEGVDTATTSGQMFVKLTAIMAEVELNNIRERVLASRDKLRREGRWAGGYAPFGMKAVRDPESNGMKLTHDPETYKWARYIVDRYIAGDTLRSISNHLKDNGVPTARGYGQWTEGIVRGVLSSGGLRAVVQHGKETVYDEDGFPIPLGEPIVTNDEWRAIQKRLTARNPRARRDAPLLSGLAFCGCGARLYGNVQIYKDREYAYYKCLDKECSFKSVRQELLDSFVEENFLRDIGDSQQTVEELVPGNPVSEKLADAESAYNDLLSRYERTKVPPARKALRAQLDAIEARMEELYAQEETEDTYVRVGTGETWQQAWDEAESKNDRRRILETAEVKVIVNSVVPWNVGLRTLPSWGATQVVGS